MDAGGVDPSRESPAATDNGGTIGFATMGAVEVDVGGRLQPMRSRITGRLCVIEQPGWNLKSSVWLVFGQTN